MKCRICNTITEKFLDLGRQPIANGFLYKNQFDSECFYDLEVVFCPKYYSVQITNYIDKEDVFNKTYPFFTSTSKYMSSHFKKLSDIIKKNYLPLDGFIFEFGSNDGTFLKNFKEYDHLGYDPSKNVACEAHLKGVDCLVRFFNTQTVEELIYWNSQADVIFSANFLLTSSIIS